MSAAKWKVTSGSIRGVVVKAETPEGAFIKAVRKAPPETVLGLLYEAVPHEGGEELYGHTESALQRAGMWSQP